MSDLASTLRRAIAASGLTQAQLADKSGVGQAKISEFLSGADMRIGNAGKLAEALRLELREKRKR
jgi:transcriptional regulator with XRE-family HTH domain